MYAWWLFYTFKQLHYCNRCLARHQPCFLFLEWRLTSILVWSPQRSLTSCGRVSARTRSRRWRARSSTMMTSRRGKDTGGWTVRVQAKVHITTLLFFLAPARAQGVLKSVCMCGKSLSRALNRHLSGSDFQAVHSALFKLSQLSDGRSLKYFVLYWS